MTFSKPLRFEDNRKAIVSDVFQVAFPAFIQAVLIASTVAIDMIMVGRLGDFAIAAVGLCFQPVLILQLVLVAFIGGLSPIIAHHIGAGKTEKANDALRQGLIISLVVSVLLSVFGYMMADSIVSLMGANAETQAPSAIYFRMLMFGLVPMSLSICITSALRGAGDVAPLVYVSAISSAVSIGFNYLLIYGNFGFPRLGVMGAGIATSLGHLTGCIITFALVFSHRRKVSLIVNGSIRLDKETVSEFLRMGLPVAGHRISVRVGMLIMVRMVSSFGTEAFAAHQIVSNLAFMAFWVGEAVSTATTSLVGQSLGMKKTELARKYISATRLFAMTYPIITGAMLILFARPLMGLYTQSEATILFGMAVIPIIAVFQPFQSGCSVVAGGLTGMKKPHHAAIAISAGIVVIRPASALLLTNVLSFGFAGIWIAIGIDEIFRFFYVNRAVRIESNKLLLTYPQNT